MERPTTHLKLRFKSYMMQFLSNLTPQKQHRHYRPTPLLTSSSPKTKGKTGQTQERNAGCCLSLPFHFTAALLSQCLSKRRLRKGEILCLWHYFLENTEHTPSCKKKPATGMCYKPDTFITLVQTNSDSGLWAASRLKTKTYKLIKKIVLGTNLPILKVA